MRAHDIAAEALASDDALKISGGDNASAEADLLDRLDAFAGVLSFLPIESDFDAAVRARLAVGALEAVAADDDDCQSSAYYRQVLRTLRAIAEFLEARAALKPCDAVPGAVENLLRSARAARAA